MWAMAKKLSKTAGVARARKRSRRSVAPTAALERALAGGDRVAALASARGAWEASRAPALAELVERLSAQLSPGAADWSLSLRDTPPREVPAYLDSLVAESISFAEAQRRVEALAQLPPDPRVAAALTRMLLAPPFTAQRSRAFWEAIQQQLTGRHADPRTLVALEPVASTYTKIFGPTVMGHQMQGRVLQMVEALHARFAVLADDAAARSLVDALAAGSPPPEAAPARAVGEAELLAAVYENPDDDEPRLVLADWLLERGDPRGELISLQYRRHRGETLTPAEEKLEKKLLAAHTKTWLGPMYGVLLAKLNVLRRGFLDEGRLYPRSPASAAAANCPAWATVTRLSMSEVLTGDHGIDILTQPSFRHLRVLLKAPWDLAAALAGMRDHRLETLGITTYQDLERRTRGLFQPRGALFDPAGLPRLRRLVLELHGQPPPAPFAALWTSPLAARLARVSIHGFWPDLEEWTRFLTGEVEVTPSLPEVDLTRPGQEVRLRAGAHGRYVVAEPAAGQSDPVL